MKAICHGKAAGTRQEEGSGAGGTGSSAPPQPHPVQLLCEAIPPPLPLGPYISNFETIPTSSCAFLQLDLNCCTKISSLPKTTFSEELGFPVSSSQSFHVCPPTTSSCPRPEATFCSSVWLCCSEGSSSSLLCLHMWAHQAMCFPSQGQDKVRVMVYKSDSIWFPCLWVSSLWRDLEFLVGES